MISGYGNDGEGKNNCFEFLLYNGETKQETTLNIDKEEFSKLFYRLVPYFLDNDTIDKIDEHGETKSENG